RPAGRVGVRLPEAGEPVVGLVPDLPRGDAPAIVARGLFGEAGEGVRIVGRVVIVARRARAGRPWVAVVEDAEEADVVRRRPRDTVVVALVVELAGAGLDRRPGEVGAQDPPADLVERAEPRLTSLGVKGEERRTGLRDAERVADAGWTRGRACRL